ncbi:MAG: hypothetical protein HC838_11125, partial [Spirulinaceae cyanobacterium RM2_2_10]|nr:hypothetical protein [Spirulinaceae cyanobacterium RM2_2_10]
TLAGWLALTGISARSLLAFQCLCYLSFSIFTALILRTYRYPNWASIAITIAFAFLMAGRGLRHDAFAMALLAAGIWCLTCDRPWRYFWGFVLLGTALQMPVNLAYGIALGTALVGCHAWQRWQQKRCTLGYGLARLGALLGAIALNFCLLLIAIDFQLRQFLDDLAWHAALRRAPVSRVPQTFWFFFSIGYNELLYGALYAFYLFLLVILWRRWAAAPATLQLPSLVLVAGLGFQPPRLCQCSELSVQLFLLGGGDSFASPVTGAIAGTP